MDDLLREFLTETNESLDRVDAELVRFEREPNNREILANVFRVVHTIKGTCGFLGLPRLETLAHAAESLMGKFRDGMPVTVDAVTLILSTIDRIKAILEALEAYETEPAGDDVDLTAQLNRLTLYEDVNPRPAPAVEPRPQPQLAAEAAAKPEAAPPAPGYDESTGSLGIDPTRSAATGWQAIRSAYTSIRLITS
jgi:two-component system, chemotaxis family, sensor kinase CheA